MTDETNPQTEEPEAPAAVAEGEEPKTAEEPKKLKQTVEMRDIGPCKKYIKVSVDRQEVDRLLEEKYSELMGDANVAGFRPGKAPRKIIERRFQKDVANQVKGELLLQSLEQLADENDVAPLSAPNLDPLKIEIPKEGPLVYEFEVEVRPDFDLPNYKGLRIKRPVREFTDGDVLEEERKLLAPYSKLVPKPQGDAQLGDVLVVDMATQVGGNVLNELKELKMRVESRMVFRDGVAERFYEQVKGCKAGDVRTVDVSVSEVASDAALRGQTIQAALTIKEVKAVEPPEMTHEFLHEFGVHTHEQLRERIRLSLQWRLEYDQRVAAREQVLGQITAASQWELPRELLARQARKALARQVMEMRNSGMSEDEIKARERLLQQDAIQSTAKSLKEIFVLQKIAEVEKLDAEEADIDAEIERMADRASESPRKLRARLEREDMLDTLAAEIIERKALDLILDSAEYEDVNVGPSREGSMATVEEQAVPGQMVDVAKEAEDAAKAAAAEKEENVSG